MVEHTELINSPVGNVFGEFHKTQWDLGGDTDTYHWVL